MDEYFLKGKVYYYSREKLYFSMLHACEEGLNKYHGNRTFGFYKALALVLCRRFHESIPKLQATQLENDLRLASLLVLIHIYELGEIEDKEILPNLYSQKDEHKSFASSSDLMESAYVLYLFEDYSSAYEYINKSIDINENVLNLCLKGWIELRLLETTDKTCYKPEKYFEKALRITPTLEAHLGQAESFIHENNFEGAQSLLNKAIIQYANVHFPLVQKMKVLFAVQDWDQFSDTFKRIISLEEHPEALYLYIVKLLCSDANFEEAVRYINMLINSVEKFESKNSEFLIDCASLLSRICDRNEAILAKTYQLIEKAVQIFPNSYKCLVELGYQCFLQKKFKEALRYYKLASKINDSAVDTLIQISLCDLNLNGKTHQLMNQIEFLLEVQEGEIPPLLKYMLAKTTDDVTKSKILFKEAIESHICLVSNISYSLNYLKILDPDFIMLLVNEMLNILPARTDHSFTSDSDILYLIDVVKRIVKACPGLFGASYLLSRLYFLSGKLTESRIILNRLLNNGGRNSSDAYLLLAQIDIKQGFYDTALQTMEVGLSNDFTIRDNVLYHYLMGAIFKKQQKLEDAIKSLKVALNLFKLKEKDSYLPLTKSSVYVELIQAYLNTNQTAKVTELLQQAMEEFKNTNDETKILMLSADQALANGDVNSAINTLENILPQDPHYLQAKMKLASIILNKRRDKFAYLNCFKDMVNNINSAESYILLGDAYLNILETDHAIKAYQTALKTNPSDPYLMSKMGKAFILTHQYQKAIAFYKESIKATNNSELKLQLADLYIQMKEFDQAEKLLSSEISNEEYKSTDDLASLKYITALLNLLADVRIKEDNLNGALDVLKNIAANQVKIRRRYSFEQVEVPEEEIDLSVKVNLKIADLHFARNDFLQAIKYQKDALSLKPNNTDIMVTLAKSYVQANDMVKCQETCNALLALEPENETALVIMADISFHEVNFEGAFVNFSNLLSKDPTNWKAMVRLIEILRRLGEIDKVSHYLDLAAKILEAPGKKSGFCFCSGLYHWYAGNPNIALKNFNSSRQDPEWSKEALCNMIEICINPDYQVLGDNLTSDDLEYKDSRGMALKTAERLLDELKQQINGEAEYKLKHRLLSNFRLLAYKEKFQIEMALEDLVSMASEESLKECVGVILGLATAYTLLKQSQRAKTQLKRVAKQNWTFEDAKYLERCWLLFADYHMQSSRYDLASELLKKVLRYNKSCIKAYEYLGFIAEKEQSHKEAVNFYDQAWKLGGKTNPAIGYKLAFSCMKCKKYAEAIETAQTVLSSYPDYPKIKKDVLDKSLNNLRT